MSCNFSVLSPMSMPQSATKDIAKEIETKELVGDLPWVERRKYKSDAFEAIHSAAAGMFRAGTIDKATMRQFDESCLTVPPSIEPAQIKQLARPIMSVNLFCPLSEHEREHGREWETGAKKPSGTALKLLALVQKHGLQHIA